MSTIDPVVLDPSISQGSKFGPAYNTVVIDLNKSGNEQRIQRWTYPKHKGDLSFGVKSAEQIEDLLAFFHCRQGMARGFLFYDSRDHAAGSLDSPEVAGVGDGTAVSFQLTKTYRDGYGSMVRRITRPVLVLGPLAPEMAPNVPPLIRIGAVQTDSSVLWTTLSSGYSFGAGGVLTFTSPPDSGVLVGWIGSFLVPVRFDTDYSQWTLQGIVGGWDQIPIVEVRE